MSDRPALASQLRTAVARLARRLRQEGAHDETSPSQLIALATLYRDGPMTVGELASSERVKPPTMTRVVAALEEQGYVRREPSPDDGRCVRVLVTDAGRAAHDRYRLRRDEWLAGRLDALSAEDLAVLAQASDILDRLAAP